MKTENANDIFISPEETSVPSHRSILIDVLIKPTDDNGDFCDIFPENSYWLNLWRNGIAQDDDDNDFMAFRTKLQWNHQKGEYNIERQFFREWVSDSSKIEDVEINPEAGIVTSKQLEPTALYFMDAKRDIDDDMKRQGSIWRKMTNDLRMISILSDIYPLRLNEFEIYHYTLI